MNVYEHRPARVDTTGMSKRSDCKQWNKPSRGWQPAQPKQCRKGLAKHLRRRRAEGLSDRQILFLVRHCGQELGRVGAIDRSTASKMIGAKIKEWEAGSRADDGARELDRQWDAAVAADGRSR